MAGQGWDHGTDSWSIDSTMIRSSPQPETKHNPASLLCHRGLLILSSIHVTPEPELLSAPVPATVICSPNLCSYELDP